MVGIPAHFQAGVCVRGAGRIFSLSQQAAISEGLPLSWQGSRRSRLWSSPTFIGGRRRDEKKSSAGFAENQRVHSF